MKLKLLRRKKQAIGVFLKRLNFTFDFSGARSDLFDFCSPLIPRGEPDV